MPAGVHYSKPDTFKPDQYTTGSGPTIAIQLRRIEIRTDSQSDAP